MLIQESANMYIAPYDTLARQLYYNTCIKLSKYKIQKVLYRIVENLYFFLVENPFWRTIFLASIFFKMSPDCII